MKVILIGYMASGKTSIGKKLARKMDAEFIDLDDYISEKEKSDIQDIFKNKGEIYFRKIETQYLQELVSKNRHFILAVGGGTPCYANNIHIINANAESVYLKSSIQTIYNKLSKEKNKIKRPLISKISNEDLKEFIAKHLFERTPFYEQAKYTVAIDEKTKNEIAEEISSKMQS